MTDMGFEIRSKQNFRRTDDMWSVPALVLGLRDRIDFSTVFLSIRVNVKVEVTLMFLK